MAGRKPKPQALRLLQGNPGKRPINTREPKPQRGMPGCPAHLDRIGKSLWRELSTELDRMEVLTLADRRALEQLCDTYALYRKARKELDDGLTYESTTEDGATLRRRKPEVPIVAECSKRMRALMTDFGLTPASRAKVSIAGTEPVDPFEEFLARGSRGREQSEPDTKE